MVTKGIAIKTARFKFRSGSRSSPSPRLILLNPLY